MEKKLASSKSRLFSFLAKTPTALFFSPGREKRRDNFHKVKLDSKSSSGTFLSKLGSFGAQEPTSPKISCMGQTKQKEKTNKLKSNQVILFPHKEKHPRHSTSSMPVNFLRRKTYASAPKTAEVLVRAPSLGEMKRFSSGRNASGTFDAKLVPNIRRQYSLGNGDYESETDCSFVEKDQVSIPRFVSIFQCKPVPAPTPVGEPRKEINLWKRRATAPLKPVEVTTDP